MPNEIHDIQPTHPQGEIILYQPDETVRLEVRLENDTVWLTQQQISILFQRERSVISRHINNVFKEEECDQKSNVHFLHIPNSDKAVTVRPFKRPFHDRFLITDDVLWHCGASFKDLGRKLFAIDKMCIDKNIILSQL